MREEIPEFKAIVFEDALLVQINEDGIVTLGNKLSKIIEIIKKANERNIPVIIRCENLVKVCTDIENIINSHNVTATLTNQENFNFRLCLTHDLEQNDCLFVTNSNLNALSQKIEDMPVIIERNMGFLSQQPDTTNKSAKAIQQFGLNQEMQSSQSSSTSSTQQKIQAIVFEDDLFTLSQKYSYKIATIIKTANEKNVPVFIRCAASNSYSEIKGIADAYKINPIIKDQFDFNKMFEKNIGFKKDDCLYVTSPQGALFKTDTYQRPKKTLINSEKDFDQLSTTIENQVKNILLPENLLLAKNINFTYNLGTLPSITLKNEHQLFITLSKANTEFNKKCKAYHPELDENATTIEIKSRAQIERFVKEHGGDIMKLYNDVDLKYSPMPEVIHAIVIEHDLLFQFPKHNKENAKPVPSPYQLTIINLIKESLEKGILIIVRCSNEDFYGDLSALLYTQYKFNREKLPIMNQSEFKVIPKKKFDLNKDDFLYVAIDSGNLYKTDTSYKTHVLLISSDNDLNYLSEQIGSYDTCMLSSEKMRVAKNVRNTCDVSKIPSIQLVNEDSLHIITCDKENKDARKIAEKYRDQYSKYCVTLDKSEKIVKITSRDAIERFVEDHGCNVKALYLQAGFTFDNSTCSLQ